jgi:hypothetical protein
MSVEAGGLDQYPMRISGVRKGECSIVGTQVIIAARWLGARTSA